MKFTTLLAAVAALTCVEADSNGFEGLGPAGKCAVLTLEPAKVVSMSEGDTTGIAGTACIAHDGEIDRSGSQVLLRDVLAEYPTEIKVLDNTKGGTNEYPTEINVREYSKGVVNLHADLTKEKEAARKLASEIASLPCNVHLEKNPTGSFYVEEGMNTLCFDDGAEFQEDFELTSDGTFDVRLKVLGSLKVDGAKVTTAGGLTPRNVIWNVKDGDVSFSDAGRRNAELYGTILALHNTVSLSPGRVTGAIISSKDITLSSGSIVDFDEDFEEPKTVGIVGDPHIKRWDGKRFSYHGECDLVMLHSDEYGNGRGLDLHIRTTIKKFYSFVESMALRIGDHVLEISSNHYYLDGTMVSEIPPHLSGDPITEKTDGNNKIVRISLNNNDYIEVCIYKIFLAVNVAARSANFGNSIGLMGDFYTGAMMARDGKTVMELSDEFGTEWQVQEKEPKLFQSKRAPQLPQETCRMPSVSAARGLRRRESLEMREVAEQACKNKPEDDFDLCVFDILATGDVGMAGAW